MNSESPKELEIQRWFADTARGKDLGMWFRFSYFF